MKKLQTFYFIFPCTLFLAAISGCKKDSSLNDGSSNKNIIVSSNATENQHSSNITVAGGGTTVEFGEKTTYEFSVVQRNGKTTGHFILKFRAAGGSLWVDLDCLRLFEDNKATISGVISKVLVKGDEPPPPFIFVGGRVSFTCQDNGEGSSASPDLVSDIGELTPGVPASCADEWPVYLPLDGNVQINK